MRRGRQGRETDCLVETRNSGLIRRDSADSRRHLVENIKLPELGIWIDNRLKFRGRGMVGEEVLLTVTIYPEMDNISLPENNGIER